MIKKICFLKAQAMIELAILGPLLLIAMGLVVTYVCKLNNDQWVLMESFRRGLQKAHDTNMISSYGIWDDRRMASVTEPIVGQKTPSSGSSCVHWSINDVSEEGQDPQGTTYVKVNGGIWAISGLNEYDIGPASGGVEPVYITIKGTRLSINTQNQRTSSVRTAGTGEFMLYKINNKNYPQARGVVRSRRMSGGD